MTSIMTEALAASSNDTRGGEGNLLPDITSLSRQSDELKVEIQSFLKSKYEDFDAWLDKTSFLNKKVEDLSSKLSSSNASIKNELKVRQAASPQDYTSVSSELEKCNQTLSILDDLLEAHGCVQTISDSLDCQAYGNSSKALRQMATLLVKLEQVPDLNISKALRVEHTLQTENLKYSLTTAWNKIVQISKPDSNSTGKDAEDISIQILKPGKQVDMKSLVTALHSEGMLQVRLKPLGDGFLLASDWIIHNTTTKVKSESDMSGVTITVTREASGSGPVSPIIVYKNLGKLLLLLIDNLLKINAEESSSLASIFGTMLSDKVQNMIVKDCLSPSIPKDYSQLEKYKETISLTEKFQASLRKYGFITNSDETLSTYVSNVNTLFANRKCQDILSRARRLMKEDIHRMVKLKPGDDVSNWASFVARGVEKSDGNSSSENVQTQLTKLSENTLKFPSCCVSESVVKLMEFAHSMLVEAGDTEYTPCSAQIFYGVRSMFELYTSVVPDYHKNSLQTLPQVSALYYNNCMFLSHQLIMLATQYKEKMMKTMKDTCAVTFVDIVPLLRAIGTEAFMDQLKTQKDNLMECLNSAHGFKNVEISANFQNASQAVKQSIHQLQHLHRVWSDVLPHGNYCKALGHLTSTVISEMIDSITHLEDISAEDTIKLNQMIVLVQEAVPGLFPGDKNQAMGYLLRHVPGWAKFSELQLVLNASLHDIQDRWADGKGPLATEFTANTVKKLIRSLFQNTDRRSQALAKIF